MNFLLKGSIQKFKKYSQFKSLKDFNNHFEQWMVDYKHQFTKSELIALKRLVRYCAKVPGVANAGINKILFAVNEKSNGYGISRSTFKRMLTKAKRIGLLEVKETIRPDRSQSTNVYIFQRFDTIEPPRTEGEQFKQAIEQEKDVEQLNPLKTSNLIKTSNIKTTSLDRLDHSYLHEYIDSSFIQVVKPYFSAKEVYKLWLKVKIAYKNSKLERPLQEVMESIIKAFKETVFLYKEGKVHTTFNGYFYRLMESKLAIEKRRERKHLLYNWLEA